MAHLAELALGKSVGVFMCASSTGLASPLCSTVSGSWGTRRDLCGHRPKERKVGRLGFEEPWAHHVAFHPLPGRRGQTLIEEIDVRNLSSRNLGGIVLYDQGYRNGKYKAVRQENANGTCSNQKNVICR